jgi:hypothetical protein
MPVGLEYLTQGGHKEKELRCYDIRCEKCYLLGKCVL